MMTTKRKRFSAEFKRQAVELLETSDKRGTELARELGVRQNQIYKWREEIKAKGEQAFQRSGRPKKENQSELSRLKQENERLKEEVEILKKAATYFAKELP
jgi:transposase